MVYAYLLDSEIIQPRIEFQTFNKNNKNIDNLIVASTFASECSGYRDFCIQDNIVKIYDHFYCDEENLNYQKNYEFKINDDGKFIQQK